MPQMQRLAVVASWNIDDVGNWLDQLGLSSLRGMFKKHAIDGQELLHLTHDNLTNDIGVGKRTTYFVFLPMNICLKVE